MTDSLSDYIQKRFDSLDKLFDSPEAHVHIRKEPPSQKHGEGLFQIVATIRDGGKEYTADHASHDMYVAIDNIKDDLQRVVRKAKTTEESLFKRGARKIKNMLRYDT